MLDVDGLCQVQVLNVITYSCVFLFELVLVLLDNLKVVNLVLPIHFVRLVCGFQRVQFYCRKVVFANDVGFV